MHALELTLILLGASIFMVALLRRLGLPTLVGYLAVGAVLGPYAGNLAGDSEVVHTLAEFGVVFLMFTLGLEFSLPKLASLRSYVFGLGPAQVLANGVVGRDVTLPWTEQALVRAASTARAVVPRRMASHHRPGGQDSTRAGSSKRNTALVFASAVPTGLDSLVVNPA